MGNLPLQVISDLHTNYCTPNATLSAKLGSLVNNPLNHKKFLRCSTRPLTPRNIGTLVRHKPRVRLVPRLRTNHACCGSAVLTFAEPKARSQPLRWYFERYPDLPQSSDVSSKFAI